MNEKYLRYKSKNETQSTTVGKRYIHERYYVFDIDWNDEE